MTEHALSNVGLPDIAVEQRLRALRRKKVDELAESMGRLGQLQPIVLQHRGDGNGYSLIAGRHRYEAAKLLGWASIDALVLEGLDADQARLAEIDENLVRANLGPAEEAAHMRERKLLYEQLHPETKHGGDRRSSKRRNCDLKPSFATDAATKTSRSRRSIEQAVRRGARIQNVAELAGTTLDHGDELNALADDAMPPERRDALVQEAKAGRKVSAKATL